MQGQVRMTKTVAESPRADSPTPRLPWFTLLLLTAVFWIGHEWNYSQTIGDRSSMSAGEYAELQHQASPLRVIAFLSLGGFAAVSLLWHKGEGAFKRNESLRWLVILLAGWAFASLLWSEDPTTSFRRLVVMAMLSLGAFAVCQRFSLRDIVLWVFLSTFCYLHIGLTAEIVLGTFRPLSEGYRFAGTMHPNGQGANCALLFFSSLFLLAGAKRWRWLLALIVCESLLVIFLTRSRTSLGSALFALLIYWFLTARLPRKAALLLSVLCALSLGVLLRDYIVPSAQDAISLGRADADNVTLTGRTFAWQQALAYIAERPFEGYGFDAFWTPRHLLEFAAQRGWSIPNAHSSYLELSLGLGLIGGVLYVLTLVVGIRQTVVAYKAPHEAGYAFLGVVLIYIALHGITESFVLYGSEETFLLILIYVKLAFFRSDVVGSPSELVKHGVEFIRFRGRVATRESSRL